MRIIILSTILFLSVNITYGQTLFQENVIIDEFYNTDVATDVIAADMDGDGDMDILTASFGDNQISWFENLDGEGAFAHPHTISINAMGVNSIFVADMDGDGDLDVLSASVLDDKVAWYENVNGAGDFSSEIVISTSADIASSVYAADLDGDGDLDVISASVLDNKIAWYENDGDTNFGTEQIVSIDAMGADSVVASDVDGDGDIDIISGSREDDKVAWYPNDGTGNFTSQIVISTEADGVQTVFSIDIDGDGDMDILSASSYDNKIAWYENTGSGVFSSEIVISTSVQEAESVYAVDIDGDGDIDVLSAARYTDHIDWYENMDGQGNFGAQQDVISGTGNALAVFAADFDGDGDIDIVGASNDNDIEWYENTNGEGSFVFAQLLTRAADRARCVYAADIDGDGDMDVLSASEEDNKIAWYENLDGNGNYGIQIVIDLNVQEASSVYSADIDGDGDMDVLSASNGQHSIAWYENMDGLGGFGPKQWISTQALNVKQILVLDIDGDNDMDVVSASSSDDKIAWYENLDGLGDFGSAHTVTLDADGAYSVFAEDLDGDGDLDLLSASIWDNKVAWYENVDGQGGFGDQQVISTSADGASFVFSADLDGDGDMDVLSASQNDDKIAWYENLDGTGVFSAEQIISIEANFASSVVAGDIDGDGDMDVVSASSSDDKIAWYENTDGQGVFSSEQIISENADGAFHVSLSDVDNDAVLDVLSASMDDDKIAWYKNLDFVSITEWSQGALSLYPNPTHYFLNIDSDKRIVAIDIYSNVGQWVYSGGYSQEIDVSSWKPGKYLCVLTDENNHIIRHAFVKQ